MTAAPPAEAERDLAARIEAADLALGIARLRRLGALPGAPSPTVIRVADGAVLLAGERMPLTGAQGLALVGAVASTDVDAACAAFVSRGLEPAFWAHEHAHPSLRQALAPRGAVEVATLRALVGATRSLVIPAARAGCPPPIVERVSEASREAGSTWLATAVAGFVGAAGQGSLDAPTMTLLAASLLGIPGVTCLLARVGGEPAGIAAVAVRDGLALLTSAATVPPFRRRGVHATLLRARLEIARSAGADLVASWVRPGSIAEASLGRVGLRARGTRSRLRVPLPHAPRETGWPPVATMP